MEACLSTLGNSGYGSLVDFFALAKTPKYWVKASTPVIVVIIAMIVIFFVILGQH